MTADFPLQNFERASWAAELADLARQLRRNFARWMGAPFLWLADAFGGFALFVVFKFVNRLLKRDSTTLEKFEVNFENYADLKRRHEKLAALAERLGPLGSFPLEKAVWQARPLLLFVHRFLEFEKTTGQKLARFDAVRRDGATSEPVTEAELWSRRATFYQYQF